MRLNIHWPNCVCQELSKTDLEKQFKAVIFLQETSAFSVSPGSFSERKIYMRSIKPLTWIHIQGHFQPGFLNKEDVSDCVLCLCLQACTHLPVSSVPSTRSWTHRALPATLTPRYVRHGELGTVRHRRCFKSALISRHRTQMGQCQP